MSGIEPAPLAARVTFGQEMIEQVAELVARLLATRPLADTSTWMSLESAADYLDWPKKRLYNLVAANEIPHRKQGNRLLFNRLELDRWLDLFYAGPSDFGP